MNSNVVELQNEIKPLRDHLVSHPLYGQINSLWKLQIFMQYHVFAVWDFMSLLKSLQQELTCVSVPWVPKGNAETRYLINEIVTGEESDIDLSGNRLSHFELYCKSMKECGCNTTSIDRFIQQISTGTKVEAALRECSPDHAVSDFVLETFDAINSGKAHVMAAVFTFGREDLIPGMFISFVKELNKNTSDQAKTFQYYLERHIEVDGDHHSHLAFQMTEHLCGDDKQLWSVATKAVKNALRARVKLWDGILKQINIIIDENE